MAALQASERKIYETFLFIKPSISNETSLTSRNQITEGPKLNDYTFTC